MSFLRDAGKVFLYRVGLVVVAFGTDVLLARFLGPAGKGYVAVLVITPVMLAVVATGGLDYALNWAGHRGRGDLFGAFSLLGLVSLALALAVAGLLALDPFHALSFLYDAIPAGLAGAVHASLAIVPADALFTLAIGLAMTAGRPVLYGQMRFARRALVLLAVVVAVLLFGRQRMEVITPIVVGQVAAIVCALALGLRSLGYDFRAPSGPVRDLLRQGAYAYPGRVAERLQTRLDFILLGLLGSGAAVGIYSVSTGIAEMLFYLSSSLATVLFSRSALEEPELHARSVRIMLPVAALMALGIGLASAVLLPLVYGSAFAASVGALWLLLPGTVFMTGVHVATPYLVQKGMASTVSKAQLGGLVGNVALNLALIPRLGVAGAAVASSVSYGVTLLWVLWSQAGREGRSLRNVAMLRGEDMGVIRNAWRRWRSGSG